MKLMLGLVPSMVMVSGSGWVALVLALAGVGAFSATLPLKVTMMSSSGTSNISGVSRRCSAVRFCLAWVRRASASPSERRYTRSAISISLTVSSSDVVSTLSHTGVLAALPLSLMECFIRRNNVASTRKKQGHSQFSSTDDVGCGGINHHHTCLISSCCDTICRKTHKTVKINQKRV